MSSPTSGGRTRWIRLDDAQLAMADERARQHERIGRQTGHRFTPTSRATLYRTYHARAEVAAESHIGRPLPAGVVVRCTPNATGRPWPRLEDVDHRVIVFARGPFGNQNGSRTGVLRYVELVGWIAGHRIEDVGTASGGGYVIASRDVEPIGTLVDHLELDGQEARS